jgi:hypothetical protein
VLSRKTDRIGYTYICMYMKIFLSTIYYIYGERVYLLEELVPMNIEAERSSNVWTSG